MKDTFCIAPSTIYAFSIIYSTCWTPTLQPVTGRYYTRQYLVISVQFYKDGCEPQIEDAATCRPISKMLQCLIYHAQGSIESESIFNFISFILFLEYFFEAMIDLFITGFRQVGHDWICPNPFDYWKCEW